MLNAGNRGCNACHEDLWDVMNMKDGYNHILTHVGYDKALTYQDCEPCHRGHTALTGPYLGDLHSCGPLRQQAVLPGGQRQLLELPCHELRRQPGRLPAGAVGRLLR